MNEDNREDSSPYEFDREVGSSARMRAIWITTAAIVVAGGLLAGAAFALTGKAEPSGAPTDASQVETGPSNSNEPVEHGEHSNKPDQHTVVVPPVSVKPNHKPKPNGVPIQAPGFTKKPHFEHDEGDNDDEHEGSDD